MKISFKRPFFGAISKTGLNQLISIPTISSDSFAKSFKIFLAQSLDEKLTQVYLLSSKSQNCQHLKLSPTSRLPTFICENYLKRSFHKCQLHTSVPDRTNSFGSVTYIICKLQMKKMNLPIAIRRFITDSNTNLKLTC